MPIPLNIIFYEPGAGGIPTTNNPTPNLGGRVDAYEQSITGEIGFDSMRCSFMARSFEEAADWANRLISSCVVTDPDAYTAWEGFLSEVEIAWGGKSIAVSLGDLANTIRVKYNDPSGTQTSTASVSSAASIARYGKKERAINFSTATAAAAANRAAIVLGQIAWPRSKRSSSAGTGAERGGIKVTLTCRGWWYAFDWLLTSSSSTATTTTTTQVIALIAAYNAINAFFSASSANITASGVSDTEKIEDETSYEEQIAKLLASGTGSQRLSWGIYEGRALTVAIWAGASPSSITYYESDRDRTIRDAQGNIIAPWRLRPDAMAQLLDLQEPAPASGPIDTLTRRYIKRVSCRITASGAEAELEADDVDSLEAILTSSAGGTSSGVSDRQNKMERKIARPARTRFSGANGTIDLGGGTVSNTGGGAIDLGTGSGIGGGGSSGVTTSGGTAGQVAEWASATALQASTLIKSGAGMLTLSSSGSFTLTVPATGTAALGTGTSGRVAEWSGTNTVQASTLIKSGAGVLTLSAASSLTLTLSGGSGQIDFTSPTTGDALIYDGSKFTPTAAPSGNGTTGRVAKWTSSTAIGADTLIKSGAGVLTLSASTTETITIASGGGGTIDLNGGTLTLGPNLTTSGAGTTLTLSSSGSFTLTIPKTGTAVVGVGSTSKLAYWTSANDVDNTAGASYDGGTDRITITNVTVSTNLRSDGTTTAASMNLNSSSAPTHTLQLTASDDAAKTTTNTWTVTSDRRTKTIIGAYEHGLAFLRQLPRAVRFEHNGKFGTEAGKRAVGFIAQEIEPIAAEWVRHVHEKEWPSDPDGSEQDALRLNTNDLIYAVLNSILELAARMEAHGI